MTETHLVAKKLALLETYLHELRTESRPERILLARHGWIAAEHASRLERMVGFRNILVHGYAEVNPRVVREVVEHHLGDLDEFVLAVRERLSRS